MSWSALPFVPLAAGERLPHVFGTGRADTGSHWHWFFSEYTSSVADEGTAYTGSSTKRLLLRPATLARVPVSIRLLMAEAAESTRRDEDDLWAEAAGDWLRRHAFDDDPVPPAPAGALAAPRSDRSWDAIDELLTTLREAATSVTESGAERAA